MSEPTHRGDAPPPEPAVDPVAFDAREELFTGTLQHANRMVNAAEAVRLHLMLVGFEAMLLEEEQQTGSMPRPDDPVVRGFYMHQADELQTTLFDIEHRLVGARILRDHLPRTWATFLGGLASERAVVVAASEALGLEGDDQFAAFDAAAAAIVAEDRPSAVKRQLKDLRETLNPAATTERHRAAAGRRFVRARQEDDGMAVLEIHSTEADIAAAYDRIRKNAVAAHGREGECRLLGALMVDEAIDAILSGRMRGPEEGGPSLPMERLGETDDPTRKLIDATVLVIVSGETATGASDVPGDIAGMGKVDAETARAIVAHTRTWTRVLVDPIDDAVLEIDSSERYIPAGLKKLLHLRQPTCGCGCGLPAHRADIDHVERFEHDGRTRHDNLQILCRRSHQAKDAGFADVSAQPDGRWKWADKWGGVKFVKPTRRVRTAGYPDEAPF